ncbi:response regulator [Streptomyces sp. 7N604]|uniref:response regulator n=1 Tax=Streptomyces sp. 7N604 TaxID=3457415 RepID=UPI003FCF23AE
MVRGPHGRPVRVLIADDDPRVRSALRTFLSAHADFDVVGEADSSAAAMAVAREHAPTVALVDVLLPDAGDGLRLLHTLTGELGIPAVAISIDDRLRRPARDAGAYQFLDKGCSPELLLAALRAATPR